MDPATLIGIGLGFVVVIVANIMEGGNPMSLLLIPPLLLVFGTTLLVCLAGSTVPDAKRSFAALKTAFLGKVQPAHDVVPIDGTDPEEVREILEGQVYAKRATDKQSAKFFADAGAYAPTIGIIGTVMGLVHVLENLAEPEELGHLIAAAFIATLWGVMSANVIWLPIASRLKRLSELEVTRMELVIEGVAAIQSGSNPRVVAAKLYSLLPVGAEEEAAKSAQKQAA